MLLVNYIFFIDKANNIRFKFIINNLNKIYFLFIYDCFSSSIKF